MDGIDDLETVIAGQRRELMAASAAESDLDLAFRLQMEEAIAASLTLLPSSASSSALLPSSASSSASASVPPAVAGDASESGDLVSILRLQELEFERFHLERKDSEHCRSEFRRDISELRRVAHDERFARQVLRMPGDEWEDRGDEFEMPIEQLGVDDEPAFRVYFKGLAERKHLGGAWVHVSAIVATVCDPFDQVILEIKKPLPISEAGDCRMLLEMKAMVEGLNAAASLGIMRVNVLCDYRTLYNHVAGIWPTKRNKIANAIDQVCLVQRKFRKCQLILIPRCHIKFVFKLARDCIETQISKGVKSGDNRDPREKCTICLELVDPSQVFSGDGCSHRFCFSCMTQHVEVKLLHGVLPGCPHVGCTVKLTVEGASKFLKPKTLDIMAQRIKESSIPANEKVYCPYPKCSALMSLSEAICIEGTSNSVFSAVRRCIKCNDLFCINCKVPWHAGLSCFRYKILHPQPHADEAKLKNLARQKLWRQCTQCKSMIELAEGCFHMTCRCGYEFCYTCGAEWKNKKATCSCPLWDERNIMHDDIEDSDFDDEDYDDSSDDYY